MASSSPLDLSTNVAQLLTELYRAHGILDTPPSVAIENSLYAEGEQAVSGIEAASELFRAYHADEGTLELFQNPAVPADLQPLQMGTGSTQLFNALLYAMAETYPEQTFRVIQKIPYFGSHRKAATLFAYPNLTYEGFHTPADVPPRQPGERFVEFVTSPNNPDGERREPTWEMDPDIIIGDFVFASSMFGPGGTGYVEENKAWLRRARGGTAKTVFTFNSASKQFGFTGDRVGYMWYPMYDTFALGMFDKVARFLSTTVGVGLRGVQNFMHLLPLITGSRGRRVRRQANRILVARNHTVASAIALRYPGSVNVGLAGAATLFMTISDGRISPTLTAADVIKQDTNVTVIKGSEFGGNDAQVRVNLMATRFDIDAFIRRLTDRATPSPVPLHPRCQTIRVCANVFYATPGLGTIEAARGCQIIVLPPFLGYEGPLRISIRNVDSCRPVRVRTKGEKKDLCVPHGESVQVVWIQPFYANGRWLTRRKHWQQQPPPSTTAATRRHRAIEDARATHFVV